MKLSDGVEWALHCATSLAQLEPGETATSAMLATYFDVPPAYLAKQLQSLVRAGILVGATGPRGGFRLARAPEKITMLQIVEAIDGGSPPFRCQEIRQRGKGALPAHQCVRACVIAAKMAEANRAWRASLKGVTLADLVDTLPRSAPARTRNLLARSQES